MSAGEVAFSVAYLLGPGGGLVGLAFGTGCAAGYHFLHRTTVKELKKLHEKADANQQRLFNIITEERDKHWEAIGNERHDCERRITNIHEDCRREINELKARVKEVEDRERSGLMAAIAQAHESAERMTGRIERGRMTPFDEGKD